MVIHRGYLGMINHSLTSKLDICRAMCRKILSATNFTQVVMKLGFHVALCAEHCHKFTHSAQDSKQHTNTTFKHNAQTVNDKNWPSVTDMKHRC